MSRRGTKSAPDLASAFALDDGELSVLTQWTPTATETIAQVATRDVAPSPFQPRGRPSTRAIAAVARAAESVGGIAALMDEAHAATLRALDGEARALAELAADVAENGVETPLEARRTERGLELLSGHRRLAAARLAGVAQVPVVDRGAMADHVAAAIVYRRNLLRKDFTAWQEAISFAAIQRNRREAALPDSVRAVARALGASHGRAGDLLMIARAFPAPLLRALADDEDAAQEALARLSFRALRELASIEDEGERVARTREVAGLTPPARASMARSAADRVERRGGGFTLTVRKSAERMTVAEAESTLALLDAEVTRLRRRIAALRMG